MKWALISLGIDAVALCVAMLITPGLHAPDNYFHLMVVIVLFVTIRAIMRPLSWLLTCPLSIVTLGPLMVGVNASWVWLSASLAGHLGVNFTVEGFGSALLGAMVLSVVRALAVTFVDRQSWRRAFRREQAWIRELEWTKKRLEERRDNWQRVAERWGTVLEELHDSSKDSRV